MKEGVDEELVIKDVVVVPMPSVEARTLENATISRVLKSVSEDAMDIRDVVMPMKSRVPLKEKVRLDSTVAGLVGVVAARAPITGGGIVVEAVTSGKGDCDARVVTYGVVEGLDVAIPSARS